MTHKGSAISVCLLALDVSLYALHACICKLLLQRKLQFECHSSFLSCKSIMELSVMST